MKIKPIATVRTVRAVDLTPAQIRAMEKAGMRVPLAARLGRGPLTTHKGATVS